MRIAAQWVLMYSLGAMAQGYRVNSAHLFVLLLIAGLALAGCGRSNLAAATSEPEARAMPTATASSTPEPTRSLEQLVTDAIDASNAGEWTLAVSWLDQALAAAPENAQAWLLRATAHRALGNAELAEADYGQALRIDPNLAAAYFGRAILYQEQGQNEAALADFSLAIERAPSYALAYKGRAAVQQAAGDYAAARLDLEVYLTLVPSAPDRASVEAQMAELLTMRESMAGEGTLLFSDDFSDPDSGWYSDGAEGAQMEYVDGGYRITINAASSGAWAYSGQIFANARSEVLAQKHAGPEDSNWFGLLCRVEANDGLPSFYAFIVSSDGYYGIGKRVSGGSLELLNAGEMQFSNAIIQGGAANLIAADCAGERLVLYVNGVKLAEVSDSDLDVGQVGLIVGTFAEPGASIFFDDFAVYAVEQ